MTQKDKLLTAVGFLEQVIRKENKMCSICGEPIDMDDFEDELSRKEYRISGMCQKCQNDFFKEEPEND